MMAASNGTDPSTMSAPERLAELGSFLALGLVRMRQPKSTPLVADDGDSSVHFSPAGSVSPSPVWAFGGGQ